MQLLGVQNISKAFGARTLFDGVSFEIDDRCAVGLVGANGTGKTTLFKMLTGESTPDSGIVTRSKSLVVGYMSQHVCTNEALTAYESVISQFASLADAEKELADIAGEIEKNGADEKILERQHLLREEFESAGGLTFRSRAQAALVGLGFSSRETELPLSALSGGQRSKLSLARLLISGANLLLLDEPTNHLDIKAIEWLEEFLLKFQGSYIIISHDRYFLDRVTHTTLELQNERLFAYKGNYSKYLEFKKQNREIEQKHYENSRREIERLEAVITEQKRWNREKSVKRAESKQKVVDKMVENLVKPEREESVIHFSFKTEFPGPTETLNAHGLSMSFGQKTLYSGLSMYLRRGERVFLLGANGCGKTSLLRQLLGQYSGQGVIRFGVGVTCGYYDQTQENLTPSKTAFDEISDQNPELSGTEIRNALAAFLFRGDDVFKKIEALSGGERARVSILKLMLSGANLLLLDEPTNHLDIGSREALEAALNGYNGTLLMVSHDRYFINKLADRIYCFEDGDLKSYTGGYDALNNALELIRSEKEIPSKQKVSGGGEEYRRKKEYDASVRRINSAIKRAEEESERIADEIRRTQDELSSPENASDYEKIMQLTQCFNELKAEEEKNLSLWEELCAQLEKLQAED